MLEYQEFPSKYIDRKRLISLLKALFPPEHGDRFEVSRRLDTWIVQAPRPLNDVRIPSYAGLRDLLRLTECYHRHKLPVSSFELGRSILSKAHKRMHFPLPMQNFTNDDNVEF